jgi:AAA15 family ATPase/GTPase
MLPLDSFSVHQFRGIKNIDLNQLGRINILVGRNNCGKTSVLEALATYARPLRPSEWFDVVRRREISNSRSVLIEGLSWLFPHDELIDTSSISSVRKTRVSGKGCCPIREVVARFTEIEGLFEDAESDQSNTDEEAFGTSVSRKGARLELRAKVEDRQENLFGSTINEYHFSTDIWESGRGPAPQNASSTSIEVETITPFSHRIRNADVEAISKSVFSDVKQTVIRLLRDFDPDIIDLQILKKPRGEAIVYVNHSRLGLTPLSTFGDGMRRALIMGATLATVSGGILLVDEIESAIHVEALKSTFQWLHNACREMNVQLFTTTHSLEAIDALIASVQDPNDLVMYRLERSNGKVKVKRFSHETLSVIREELGLEIRS